MNLPATRLSQYAMQSACEEIARIRPFVRKESTALTTACRQAGMPMELAEVCGGLLASVVDDLVAASGLPKSSFERTKRMVRVLKTAQEPASHALRLAMAASPINGEAAVMHWDAICEDRERGKLAWLLGMSTEAAWKYGKRMEKMTA
jgi:hypothetical protein